MVNKILTHPDKDTLAEFAEAPHLEKWADIRMHLLECAECRLYVQKLQALNVELKDIRPQDDLETTALPIDDETLMAYLAKALPAGEMQRIDQLTKSNGQLLKALLHMRSHVSEEQLSQFKPSYQSVNHAREQNDSINGFSALLTQLLMGAKSWFNFQPPVWATALFVLGFVGFMGQYQSKLIQGTDGQLANIQHSNIHVAQYQDQTGITWTAQAQQPGIGFFRQPDIVQDYDGLKVSFIKEKTLALQWPQLDNVDEYRLRLLQVGQVDGRKQETLLHESTVKENSLQVELDRLLYNRRYQWQLIGTDQQGRRFKAEGGFVLKNKSFKDVGS